MRDRARSRKYSAGNDAFRRDHARRRAWGLAQRHAEKLRRESGTGHAAERHFAAAAAQRCLTAARPDDGTDPRPTPIPAPDATAMPLGPDRVGTPPGLKHMAAKPESGQAPPD